MFRNAMSRANIRYRIVHENNNRRKQMEFLTEILQRRPSGKMIVYANAVSTV